MTTTEKEGDGPVSETASHQNTSPHPHDQAADAVQSNGDRGQDASPEISFLCKLANLGCAVWTASPGYECEEGRDCAEFHRPLGWQQIEAEGSLDRLIEQYRFDPDSTYSRIPALCANMGGKVAVVDADPRNEADIEKVRNLLDELKVRIFGQIATPSGGKHFYIAGHEDLPSVHSTVKNNRLPGYPGVDIQSFGCNVFLPGTFRWKKGDRGYTIESDNLDALINEGDPEGAERFANWVADQLASNVRSSAHEKERCEFVFDPAPEWDGSPPDRRQQKYLDTVLAAEVQKVSQAQEGERNHTLNVAALKCGHYVAGAGMDQDKVIEALELAATECGLADDDGIGSVHATIRSGLRAGMKTPRAVQDKPDRKSHMGERTIRLTPMSSVVDDVPEWALCYDGEGRIQRGTLTLFAGRPGAGKSTALRWAAAGFSLGKFEGCWHQTPQNIAYIAAAEESLRYAVKPGLRAAGADIDRISYPKVEVETTDEGVKVARLSALADELALTKALQENNITVVLVDPIMSTIAGDTDIYRNNETREHLEPWARIADTIGGLTIGVVHLNKGRDRDVVGAINGSSAFGEVARGIFGFAKDPKSELDHRIMSQHKNSAGLELRPRRLRGVKRRAGFHQGRREHQLSALHALARPISVQHGSGQPRAGRHRRDQGPLHERHRRHHGGDCTSGPSSPRISVR